VNAGSHAPAFVQPEGAELTRLVDRVYRELDRKLRLERARRGR
jgi:hypothetical protein